MRRCFHRLRSDDGNVVLETALGIVALGAVVLPALTGLAAVASARHECDVAAAVMARAWSAGASGARLTAARAAAALFSARSTHDLRVSVRCSDVCTASGATVTVTAVAETGLLMPQVVFSEVTMGKDAYAPD